ncbi:MAG: NAD(P)-dependent oxidoreductase [Rhodospirillaceae bacterium]|jgi:uronate dehydrogenase|nr:NAD(P)-dependent oxidoreductase [Rhodospirillaceae bacterium]
MKVLVTGAAGAIGRVLRDGIAGRYDLVRLTDRVEMAPARQGVEVVQAELTDMDAVCAAMEGMDAVVHLSAIAFENEWDAILPNNIAATYNVIEAARRCGARRIVFASSNHAISFYRRSQLIDHTVPHRPDTRYGLTKAFGEDLGSLYVDKHDMQFFSMRIGSFQPEPREARQLATWLSHGDMTRLVTTGLETPELRFAPVYGISRNTRTWWDNSLAYSLGYDPQDNAEDHAERLLSADPPEPGGPVAHTFQGGIFPEMEFDGDLDSIP